MILLFLRENIERIFAMKKILLTTTFILVSSVSQAAGLYISGGYSKSAPDLSNTGTSAASDSEAYNGVHSIPGWPGNYSNPDANGYKANAWEAGLATKTKYNNDKGNIYSIAVGWQIPKNPFRFELEYSQLKFKSNSYDFTIYDPNGKVCGYKWVEETSSTVTTPPSEGEGEGSTGTTTTVTTPGHWEETGECISTDQYQFGVSLAMPMETKVSALMANVLFEIPGFGPIDPYIGYGYGKAKMDWTINSSYASFSGGSDGYGEANQWIAGVELRIVGTPWIIGAEYRDMKFDFDERDDKEPYKFRNKSIMFKAKYDFVSDKF